MTRCDEFYEKVERDGNFCGLDQTSYKRILDFRDLLRRNPTIVGITEGAGRVLIREKDSKVKAKAIDAIGRNMKDGNKPTAKQVKQIVDNNRTEEETGGRAQGIPRDVGGSEHIRGAAVVFPPGGDEEHQDETEDIDSLDTEEDYYSGDTPETPDTQEKPEAPKADVVVPRDVSDIEDQMEEERVAQEAREVQKRKGEEKDRRELAALEEKNENTKMRDELAADITEALKKAIRKGISRKYVSDALRFALDNVFEAERPSNKNSGDADQGQLKSGGLFK